MEFDIAFLSPPAQESSTAFKTRTAPFCHWPKIFAGFVFVSVMAYTETNTLSILSDVIIMSADGRRPKADLGSSCRK